MNKYKYIFKFLYYSSITNKFNFNLLLPFIGVIIGTLSVALTFAIMDGLENEIFTKLKNVSFPAKLSKPSWNKFDINKLDSLNINFQKGIETEIVIANGYEFRLVNLRGIEHIENFIDDVVKGSVIGDLLNKDNGIYIGKQLANKLNVVLGDPISIYNLNKLDIFTGLPEIKNMVICGIFDFNIIDYDQKYIFAKFDHVESIFKENMNVIYFDRLLNDEHISYIKNNINGSVYSTWIDEHITFVSAMKLEKIVYSIIGFLIVLISSFTLMSMMSLSVMQKVPQIGILTTIGLENIKITYIFIFQSVFTSLISNIVGLAFSYFIIYLDGKFKIIMNILSATVNIKFNLILSNEYVLLIIIVTMLLMLISSIYPAYKAYQIDPIDSIAYKRS